MPGPSEIPPPAMPAMPSPDSLPASAEECWVRLNSNSLHDLIGPVNQLGTITDLLIKKYHGAWDADAQALFGFIQSSVERLQNLATGLRTYLRVAGSPGPYRLCDGNALLAAATLAIQSAIDENAALVTHDPLPELYCDPNQIGYAFESLLENSIKFRRAHPPEVHISAAAQENAWLFSVRDNGIGIPPAHRDSIFGMFKRIHHEAYPGAGVGLALTRQIVERHGGRIWVESQPGEGATFFFSLAREA
jgi:light-regulated signal transduction histidine kinase (bacteriophytochrome)